MISLKAIFTSGRKLSLLLLILALPLAFVHAESYRVGFYFSGDDSEFERDVRDSLALAASEVDSPVLLSKRIAREMGRNEVEWRKSENERILNEGNISNSSASDVARFEFPEDGYSIEIVDLTLDEHDADFLLSGDEVAISYLKILHNLDEIVFVSSREGGGLYENRVNVDGKAEALFLNVPGVSSLFGSLTDFFLSHYRKDEMRAVRLDGNVEVSVKEGDAYLGKFSSWIVMSVGDHQLLLESEGYDDLMVDYALSSSSSTENVISYSMNETRSVPIFISTIPYTNEVFYQGRLVSSGYEDETRIPFTITASSPGFETRTVQSSREVRMMEVRMLPTAYYDPDRLERAKNDFYWNMLGSLCAFGLFVGSNAIDGIIDQDISYLTYGFLGVGVLSLIRTMEALFDYKDAAIMSI